MKLFELPDRTKIRRVIPKNSFDSYTNTKQKKLLTDLVLRISWIHKLATDTVNLDGKDIREIQIFQIDLKQQEEIPTLLTLIDKAIPYHILFIVRFEDWYYLSTSAKHLHPNYENQSVIDWTFQTDWFQLSDSKYSINLRKSLDFVFFDICCQIADVQKSKFSNLNGLIEYQEQIESITKEINRLKSTIKRSNQFNEKVELNLKLKAKESELERVSSGNSIT